MQAALKLKAPILPGKRIEFTAPELPESGEVELIVVLPAEALPAPSIPTQPRQFKDVMEFLNSLPDRSRTPEEWEAIEREFQEERNSWDR